MQERAPYIHLRHRIKVMGSCIAKLDRMHPEATLALFGVQILETRPKSQSFKNHSESVIYKAIQAQTLCSHSLRLLKAHWHFALSTKVDYTSNTSETISLTGGSKLP